MVLRYHFKRVQVVEHRGREVPELPPPQRSEEHHQEVQPEQQHHHIKGRQAGRHRDQVNPSPSNRQEQPESNQILPQTRTALLGYENWRSGQEDGRSLSGLQFFPCCCSICHDFFPSRESLRSSPWSSGPTIVSSPRPSTAASRSGISITSLRRNGTLTSTA